MKQSLLFGSRAYRALVRDYGLTQEYIAPYPAEQNSLCERFIRGIQKSNASSSFALMTSQPFA